MNEAISPKSKTVTIRGKNSIVWVAESNPKIPLSGINYGVDYLVKLL
jgi:hypothetical protein